ncbi:biotin-dependent carboxylase uncharacterized domain-containing protein [Nocardioides scoriae]|uniref:Biotin-dependent carboxylase uncharacterized domain-containing protein n=1 Tax=Nocardioides scoriae TaxID=642780 RepID=A0A1H1QE81_9ACTN|nr:biotin-dependent carboxyltransferase family protein [Nocardioides scoriae]SDS21760.1 biotin-dependent carboxylase uncharacterized domain-containing protein [Nocardioides scoriae]
MPERVLEVLDAGPQVLVVDLGRPGLAHLGVPRSGALDLPAHRLADRLVGNPESAATLEVLGGGLRVRTSAAVTVAVTGAVVAVAVDGRPAAWGQAVAVPAGATVTLGPATAGLRASVAVSGGVAVAPVLGSRSSDVLSGLGPRPVTAGDRLPLGDPTGDPVPVDAVAPVPAPGVLDLVLGPRDDWFVPASVRRLGTTAYVVGAASNRIGLRLEGEPVVWERTGELASEGMVLGAVQVPPGGQPVVFLADHPTTGGYPVVGVVDEASLARCAQLRPGDEVRFRVRRG